MEKECGVLQQTGPKIFNWKVGSKNSAGRWISTTFSIYSNKFLFLIQPIETETNTGIFCLCEKINGTTKSYDLDISLTYNDSISLTSETKSLLKKNTKPEENGPWCTYKLARIKTDNLLETTCTFLKRGIWNETTQVLGESFHKKQ